MELAVLLGNACILCCFELRNQVMFLCALHMCAGLLIAQPVVS